MTILDDYRDIIEKQEAELLVLRGLLRRVDRARTMMRNKVMSMGTYFVEVDCVIDEWRAMNPEAT